MDSRALRGRSPFSGGFLAPSRLVSDARHPKIPFFCFLGPKKLLQASFGVFEEILRDMSTFVRFGGGGRRSLEEQQRHKDLRRPKHETAHALASAHLLHQGRPDVWSRGSFGAVSKF